MLFSISPKCSRSCAAYTSSNAASNVLLNGNDISFSHCAHMSAAIFVFNFNDTFQNNKILIEIMPVDRPITHRRRKKNGDDLQRLLSASWIAIENVSDYRINYSKPFEICTSHLRQAHFMQCKISSTFQPWQIQIYIHDVDCISMDADSFFLPLH